MGKFEEDVKIVIDALLEGITADIMEDNPETVDKLRGLSQEKGFLKKLERALSRFYTIVLEVTDIPEQRNMYIVKHIISGLYKHFFRQYIERVEGFSGCADKARFITRMTLKALEEGGNVSLFEDYTRYDQIVEGKEEQAYWSPRTVKDTDTAMELFVKWYYLKGLE